MSHFNQVANTWDTPEKIALNQVYAEKIKTLSGKKHFHKILEVGCGTGLLGANFVEANNILIGVDTSEGMLGVFSEKFLLNENVHAHLLNLEKEELTENNFDLIISSMAFHHLKAPEQMLGTLKSKISQEGIIAVIDLDKEDGTFHPDPVKMGVHHFGFSSETAESWAKAHGLKMKREIIHVTHKNDKDYPIFLALFFK